MKKLITTLFHLAIVVLLVINIVNIVQKGPSVLNIMAIIVSCIYLALIFVDKMREE